MSLDGVEKTVRMLLRRGCMAVRSGSWRRQPEKLGYQHSIYKHSKRFKIRYSGPQQNHQGVEIKVTGGRAAFAG